MKANPRLINIPPRGNVKEKNTMQELRKGQILRSTPNTAPLICGAYNTQPEGLLTTA